MKIGILQCFSLNCWQPFPSDFNRSKNKTKVKSGESNWTVIYSSLSQILRVQIIQMHYYYRSKTFKNRYYFSFPLDLVQWECQQHLYW